MNNRNRTIRACNWPMTKAFPLFVLFFILAIAGVARSEELKEIVIDAIKVNDAALAPKEYTDIVISTEDEFEIFYHCEAGESEKIPFLFKILTKNSKNENSTNVNVTSIKRKNLPEDKYIIQITAFDPSANWTSMPENVYFRVDNREAATRKEIKQLRDQLAKDSLDRKNAQGAANGTGFDMISIGIGLLCGISIVIFVVIVKSKNRVKEKKILSGNNVGEPKMANNVSQEKIDSIVVENAALKAEIAALRSQIDSMQARGDELIKQNQELRDSADKLQKSQKEFEELQKQKDDLFAIIIHDIKNPAALIKSLVELLRSYDLTAGEQQEIIDDIFETTARIVSLSQEVSRILALESSSLRMDMELADITEVVNDVYRRNLVGANKKNIEMLLDFSSGIPETMMDVQKIDEVLDNLISNALKFSHEKGTVRIRTHKQDSNILIEISDNGLGLSEEDIKEAFQRGAKLSAKPTQGEPSSGLGLWIVKKLIEAHKGRVWVKSTLGKGSTFSISLPIVKE